MVDLFFIYGSLFIRSLFDILLMSKSEMVYWGYDDDPNTAPKINQRASDNASWILFSFWLACVLIWGHERFGLTQEFGYNLGALLINYWCGVEDLGYFLLSNIIKLSKEYLAIHPQKFGIPDTLYWLSKHRYGIPSIIGFFCGEEVKRNRFLFLTITVILTTIILSFYI
jgi:hypothetical protein